MHNKSIIRHLLVRTENSPDTKEKYFALCGAVASSDDKRTVSANSEKVTCPTCLSAITGKRLLDITGHTSDLDEALTEFENVKEAVGELFDENQALAILNRRMALTIDFAVKAMDIVERDAAMFITPKARKWIEQFREQYGKLSNTVAQSKELTQKEKPARLIADS